MGHMIDTPALSCASTQLSETAHTHKFTAHRHIMMYQCSRTITYNYRCHITPVYKSLNILKLHDIYKLELAELMHKFHHEMLPTSFKDLFQKTAEVHCHNTRYATNQKTISYNKFQQTLAKKQFLIEELHIGQM